MTRTMESFARVARWPYAGSPPKSTNSLIKSSMSARDPSGLPNGPTGSSRRRLLPIFSPNPDRNLLQEKEPAASAPDKVGEPREAGPDTHSLQVPTAAAARAGRVAAWRWRERAVGTSGAASGWSAGCAGEGCPGPGDTGKPPDPGSGVRAGICVRDLKFWIHPAFPVLF